MKQTERLADKDREKARQTAIDQQDALFQLQWGFDLWAEDMTKCPQATLS